MSKEEKPNFTLVKIRYPRFNEYACNSCGYIEYSTSNKKEMFTLCSICDAEELERQFKADPKG